MHISLAEKPLLYETSVLPANINILSIVVQELSNRILES